MRPTLVSLLAAVLLAAIVAPALAQEPVDICLGGGLVARLRDPGAFASVKERAANIDQKIVEIVSSKDTQRPQVSVKQRGNLWTVYAWEIPLLSVYPAEAKTNKMTEKQLAEVWSRNLQQQLPKATPCSKLPPEQLGYGKKPAATTVTTNTGGVAAKPAAASPPAGTAAAKPATTAPAKPATTAPAKPLITPAKPATTAAAVTTAATTAVQPATTMPGNETGALLLIVDAMRTARDMNDQDWAARKETLARELYGNMSYYLTGKGTKPAATTAVAKPPVTATVKPPPAAKPPAAASATPKPPATAATTAKPPVTAATATASATDPTMAKVPQKNRIRAKFAAAKPAYDKLATADPEAAKRVSDMLTASRQAFAYGNFDESEQHVDEALAALGVTFTP